MFTFEPDVSVKYCVLFVRGSEYTAQFCSTVPVTYSDSTSSGPRLITWQ